MSKMINPGDKVFFAIPYKGLVVPATVIEVTDVYGSNTEFSHAVFYNRDSSGTIEIYTASGERDKDGWPAHVDVPIEKLKDLQLVNQLIWIDEPVGHAVRLGEDVFFKLSDALKVIDPIGKKKKHRRFRKWRNLSKDFIAESWEMHGERYPGSPKYPNKRIYTRSS